jgi:hypothetical protein
MIKKCNKVRYAKGKQTRREQEDKQRWKVIKTKIHGCVDGFVLKAVNTKFFLFRRKPEESDFVSLGLDQCQRVLFTCYQTISTFRITKYFQRSK